MQHTPVFDDLPLVIKAENVDGGVLLASPVQVPHVGPRQVSIYGYPLDLARNAAGLLEIADQRLIAVREERVVLNVRA